MVNKLELRWVIVYQILYKLLSYIGYNGEVILDKSDDDSAPRCFSLDEIIMKELIDSRDPQVIRHFLQYSSEDPSAPHIA